MTIRLPFLNHIKVLFGTLNNEKDVVLNRLWNYEVEIPPSLMQGGSQQNPLPSAHAIKSRATVAPKLVFTRASRLWSVNQESSWYVEHTRSNLG